MSVVNMALAGTVFLLLRNVDKVSFAGPRPFCRSRLVHLPRGPHDSRSSAAHHTIDRDSHSRNKIADQGFRGYEDGMETPSATS